MEVVATLTAGKKNIMYYKYNYEIMEMNMIANIYTVVKNVAICSKIIYIQIFERQILLKYIFWMPVMYVVGFKISSEQINCFQ